MQFFCAGPARRENEKGKEIRQHHVCRYGGPIALSYKMDGFVPINEENVRATLTLLCAREGHKTTPMHIFFVACVLA
jgi:hypothetical protein